MVKTWSISQHLNEENKNISKAAKCLYMFIHHLQRHDSPSVMVTVKNSTNVAVAAAGHVVAIRGLGVWVRSSDQITPDLAKFDWDFNTVCPVGGAVSVAGGRVQIRFFFPLLKKSLQFSLLWIPLFDVRIHTISHTHTLTNTDTRTGTWSASNVTAFCEKCPSAASSLQEKKRAAEGRYHRGHSARPLRLLGHFLSAGGRHVTAWRLSEVQLMLEKPIRTPGSQISNVVSTH